MKRTQQIEQAKWIESLIKSHVTTALAGTWDGRQLTAYFQACRTTNPFRGMTTIFTRDTGHHTSGWWKNPDYERCYHFSVSFFDPVSGDPRPHDKSIVSQLVNGLFNEYAKWVWVEPPYSADGQQRGVWHYRLFCDEGWQPLKPRGEVYSRELTKAGWKSFSDVQDDLAKTGRNPNRKLRK